MNMNYVNCQSNQASNTHHHHTTTTPYLYFSVSVRIQILDLEMIKIQMQDNHRHQFLLLHSLHSIYCKYILILISSFVSKFFISLIFLDIPT